MTRVGYKGNKSPDIHTSESTIYRACSGCHAHCQVVCKLVLFHSQHYYISTGTGYISDVEIKTLSAPNFISMECLSCSEKSLHSFALCMSLLLLNLIKLAPKQCSLYFWAGGFLQRREKGILMLFVHLLKGSCSLPVVGVHTMHSVPSTLTLGLIFKDICCKGISEDLGLIFKNQQFWSNKKGG